MFKGLSKISSGMYKYIACTFLVVLYFQLLEVHYVLYSYKAHF